MQRRVGVKMHHGGMPEGPPRLNVVDSPEMPAADRAKKYRTDPGYRSWPGKRVFPLTVKTHRWREGDSNPRSPRRMDDAFETALFASPALPVPPERPTRFARGTGGSNLLRSSGESGANLSEPIEVHTLTKG